MWLEFMQVPIWLERCWSKSIFAAYGASALNIRNANYKLISQISCRSRTSFKRKQQRNPGENGEKYYSTKELHQMRISIMIMTNT